MPRQETALNLKRGDIYWVDLNPTVGSEIKKLKTCVLMGATPINQARRTVLVIPLSSSGVPRPPLAIEVECLGRKALAVCDQLRAVDKSRLREPAGSLAVGDLEQIEEALRRILSL
jgi:mRNA interferase MazF